MKNIGKVLKFGWQGIQVLIAIMATFLTAVPGGDTRNKDGYKFSERQADPRDEEKFSKIQTEIAAVTQMAQSTLLIQKRRELAEIDANLAAVKEEYNKRMVRCYERQSRFEQKQRDMKAQVEKFQKFIHENNHKRQRADLKEKAEVKQRQQHESTINKRQQEFKDLSTDKKRLQKELKVLLKYQEYLENLVESSPDIYEEVWEVLNRHKTLQDTKNDLEAMVNSSNQTLEGMRNKLSQLRSEGQKAVLVRQGLVHKYQKRVEELHMKALKTNTQIERDMMTQKEKSREFSQVMMATRNLHARCVATRNKRNQARRINQSAPILEQVDEALQYISSRIIVLQDIKKGYPAWKEKRRQDLIALGKAVDETSDATDERKGGNYSKRPPRARAKEGQRSLAAGQFSSRNDDYETADDGTLADEAASQRSREPR